MNKKGFTLIEMLLVVVIIGILTIIVYPNLSEILSSGKEKKYENYVELLEENLKLYRIDKGDTLWINGTNTTSVLYENLQKSNPDINIGDCTPSNLIIEKTGSTSYKYTYKVCITCNGNSYGNYTTGCTE